VYAKSFHSPSDQQRINDLIDSDRFFKVSPHLQALLQTEIDTSVPGMLRVGAVYLTLGSDTKGELRGAHRAVFSPETVSKLELLSAAVQSGRAVLLEGDTASGKTALPKELTYSASDGS
jgi:hypothetical protein